MADQSEGKRKKSIGARLIGFLSGYGLAAVCLLLLGLLTWLSTLEQTNHTLLETTRKYFHYENLIVFADLESENTPFPLNLAMPLINVVPLPNGFWVGLVFFINLLLGTILRVRKRPKQIGILISHCGMLLLLVGAFVTQVASERGNMAIDEGEISDVATHYTDHALEVAETEEGKISKVHVIEPKHLEGLDPDEERLFRMKNLPFDVRVTNYHLNARPVPETELEPGEAGEVIDGFVLNGLPPDPKEAERNLAGCHAEIVGKDGTVVEKLLLSSASVEAYPATFKFEDKVYALTLRKALWKMPFEVQLDKFTHEFHPGTRRPRVFKSNITRLEGDTKTEKLIEMNHPMRYQGYTFFQASWGPQDDPAATQFYSVFEVVKNPADQWPLVSLIITGAGLLVHFVYKLVLFIVKQVGKNAGS